MPSFTLFALKVVAPALAKSLVKAFDIPSDVQNELWGALIDAAAGEVLVSRGERASLEKTAEKMAGQMAVAIRPLFLGMNRRVGEHSQNAIVLGLGETLLEARLTQAKLVEMSLDAGVLAQYLLDVHPGVDRHFSADEQAIYRQAVGIVSEQIIEAAPEVEGFELNTAAETLKRLNGIIRQLRFERERETQAADEFVGRYRATVEDELDKLEVFGLPRMDRLTSRQSLSMAYITLSTSEEVSDKDSDRPDKLSFVRGKFGKEDKGPKRVLCQVDGAMCERQRLVIRGGAGAGKSTLMQWLAVRAAGQNFEGKLQPWNNKIPFFIRLRNLVGEKFPTPEKFPALVAPNFAAMMPDKWVHKYLDRGQALVLIDGVDELPKQNREVFLADLKALVRDFPNATYIVTSRPSGLKSVEGGAWETWEDWVADKDFGNLMLEPMTTANVEEFVSKWHAALPKDMPGCPVNPQQAVQNLTRQLRQRPELQRLASTPLLCAMICALHRERLETLPSARLELYRDCIDMLLNRRDQNRKIKLDETYPIGLNEQQKIELLQSLALKLMRLNLSSLEVDRVDSHFNLELKQTGLPPEITGEQIRALFVDRAALLREPVVGQIDFAHRTFQEYLAAKAVLEDDSFEELMQKADDDQWREAIIVAAGLARPKEREKILESLIDQGTQNTEAQQYLHLLAVACLETTTKVNPETRSHVLACAKALMPPKDDDEVAMVVRAGNESVPLLAYEITYSDKEMERCINALVSIGTHKAMTALINYAKVSLSRDQEGVARSIGRGWSIFERGDYLARVLSQLNFLYLDEMQVSDISFLSALTRLNLLSLSRTQVSDVSPLSHLSKLSFLSLFQTQVSDVSPLSHLSQLSVLILNQKQVSDISPLSHLSKLSGLNLSQTQVSDISPLSNLSELRSLDLSQTQVSDISPLSNLSKLSGLYLSQTQVSDVSPFSHLSKLRSLNLSQTQVSDISPLSNLSKLMHLSLDQTQVSNVSPLSNLSKLSYLNLSQTQVSDVSPFSNLSQLSILYLSQTQVCDISPLKRLKRLTVVIDDEAKAKQWKADGFSVELRQR